MNTHPPVSNTVAARPEFIRLPKAGTLCPITGMTRSALNDLVLPTLQPAGQPPPVKSVSLKKPGAQNGVRLINVASLLEYLHAHTENGNS